MSDVDVALALVSGSVSASLLHEASAVAVQSSTAALIMREEALKTIVTGVSVVREVAR